jgi:hypothetical protein
MNSNHGEHLDEAWAPKSDFLGTNSLSSNIYGGLMQQHRNRNRFYLVAPTLDRECDEGLR